MALATLRRTRTLEMEYEAHVWSCDNPTCDVKVEHPKLTDMVNDVSLLTTVKPPLGWIMVLIREDDDPRTAPRALIFCQLECLLARFIP